MEERRQMLIGDLDVGMLKPDDIPHILGRSIEILAHSIISAIA